MRRISLAFFCVYICLVCCPAHAASVDLDLLVDMDNGSWEVFAEVQGGSLGLDGFSFDVVGTDGIAVSSSANQSPTGFDGAATWGFGDFRFDGTNGLGIMAVQYSVYGPTNDPVKDALVLQEIGIAAGSRLSDPGSDPQMVTWDAKVLLASGTFSGEMGSLTVAPRAGETWSLLSDTGGGVWSGPGNLEPPSAVNGYSQPIIPADFNLDGAVDVSDLGILASGYGMTEAATWADGDANWDDAVDVSDLGVLATHYGTGAAVAAVPEPSAAVLLGVGLLAVLVFCRLAAHAPRGAAVSRERNSP